MTSPISPETVAQMLADLDLFSRCGDVGVMDRDMAIDAKATITTLSAENATLRASEAAALERVRVLERECRLTQAQVDRMLVNSTKMDANITTLTEAAARVLHDIDDIVANSEGVAGLHMNGEVAEWHSLMSGGSFEAWLRSVEVLRAALTPTADKEPKS